MLSLGIGNNSMGNKSIMTTKDTLKSDLKIIDHFPLSYTKRINVSYPAAIMTIAKFA